MIGRVLTLAIVAALTAGAAHAADQAEQALTAKAEACIKANAADSERLNPSLADAARFLSEYICAREVGLRELYKRNAAMLESYRSMAAFGDADVLDDPALARKPSELMKRYAARQQQTKAAYEKAYVDPETGEIVTPEKLSDQFNTIFITSALSAEGGPSDLRAVAGRAVLDARIARLKTESR